MIILTIAVIIIAISDLVCTIVNIIGFTKNKEIMFLTDTINNANKEIAVRDHNVVEVRKQNDQLNKKVFELTEYCISLKKTLNDLEDKSNNPEYK